MQRCRKDIMGDVGEEDLFLIFFILLFFIFYFFIWNYGSIYALYYNSI
jgi:hypothetical protein